MDSITQILFVSQLSQAVTNKIIKAIRDGKVPESFDGHELRVLLAKEFQRSADMSIIVREPRSKRAKDFKNWTIITDL